MRVAKPNMPSAPGRYMIQTGTDGMAGKVWWVAIRLRVVSKIFQEI